MARLPLLVQIGSLSRLASLEAEFRSTDTRSEAKRKKEAKENSCTQGRGRPQRTTGQHRRSLRATPRTSVRQECAWTQTAREAQHAKLSAAPQRKIALCAKEPKEAGDVVSKSRGELARKRALDKSVDGEAKAAETNLSGKERETRRKRYCAAIRFLGDSLQLQPTWNKHIFHSGSQSCLEFRATPRWRRGRVVPSFPQAATPTRHGRSRKPIPLFGVQASLLDGVPCTLILVFCMRHTLLDRSRGPVPFDGPGETAGLHPVNVCEATLQVNVEAGPDDRGPVRHEICSLTAS